MWEDPIVAETRALREEYAAQFNHDVDAIYEDALRKQVTSGRKYVSFSKQTADAPTVTAVNDNAVKILPVPKPTEFLNGRPVYRLEDGKYLYLDCPWLLE